MTSKKRVLAVWDTRYAKCYLGFIIIFLSELESLHSDKKLDVAYIGNNTSADLFNTVIQFSSRIERVIRFDQESDYLDYLDKNSNHYTTWPNRSDLERTSYYGSTLFLQEICEKNGGLNCLALDGELKEQSTTWLSKYCQDKLPVVVHLKNNPEDTESNADIESWEKFFRHCEGNDYPIKFILVGSDSHRLEENTPGNVIYTKHEEGNLKLDLALILSSYLFMGMSSGPCNMAIFSDVPYLIWKHPNHHADEMEREFQGGKQFSFSRPNQKFIRKYDTFEEILKEFDRLYSNLDPGIWKIRVGR